MPRGLDNRPARAAIARRMRREHGDMLRANEQESHFLRRLVTDHAKGIIVVAAAAGALTWYRGGVPSPWQLVAIGTLAIGIPLARRWVRSRRAARV
jgi:hypothetical protein